MVKISRKALRGPVSSAKMSRLCTVACVRKWMSNLRALATLFSGCVHTQNSDPVTWLTCQLVHLRLFRPQVEISLRFQLECVASSCQTSEIIKYPSFFDFGNVGLERRNAIVALQFFGSHVEISFNLQLSKTMKALGLVAVVAASKQHCLIRSVAASLRHFLFQPIDISLLISSTTSLCQISVILKHVGHRNIGSFCR